jgi:pyridine nucleotide-disulfide oxidoreductase family protein
MLIACISAFSTTKTRIISTTAMTMVSKKSTVLPSIISKETKKRLVLVGGGHAHVQVIKGLNHASRPQNLDVILIDLTDHPCYSGMVPSLLSGIYSPEETLIELRPLASWSGIQFIQDRVIDIDTANKIVITAGKQRISFDAISIDIGSTSRGLIDIPGAKKYCIPTRPISELVRRVELATIALVENSYKQRPVNVIVVGGGAAGIELSMSILGRWKPIVGNIKVTLLNSYNGLFPDETPVNREALIHQMEERGICIVNDAKVDRVDQNSLKLQSGECIEFTHCLWATGARSHTLSSSLQKNGLAISKNGWIRVNEYFQSMSHEYVFAAGDCCTMEIPGGRSSPPKAGVYAVRAGPILIENLTRFLSSKCGDDNSPSLKAYVPQGDFLKLLACGDGKALGFRFGIPIYGRWVFQLKDAIDRSFMDLFRKENLPELIEGQPYDTSQYDDSGDDRPSPLSSIDAAILLQRTDDDVDFRQAWNVLKDMAENDNYRDKVLHHVGVPLMDKTNVQ